MSKKESNRKEVNKVQTKYDRKMQQRKEIEAREKKEKIRNRIIAIVAIVIVLCFIISFPIKSYSAKNQPYITINDEKITQIEFQS